MLPGAANIETGTISKDKHRCAIWLFQSVGLDTDFNNLYLAKMHHAHKAFDI